MYGRLTELGVRVKLVGATCLGDSVISSPTIEVNPEISLSARGLLVGG